MPPEDAREQAQEPISECDYCGLPFAPKRPWARYCCEDHRRAFERIVRRITTKIAPEIREGVRELLEARA